MRLHILHISNGFCNSKVHASLCKKIAAKEIEQTIYCPVRQAKEIGRNSLFVDNINIIYDMVIKPFYRYAYHFKCHAIFHSLIKKVNLQEIDMCHASTLFTDGSVAYKIYKKHSIPYVVAVRSTDVNVFLKRAPHTWLLSKKILKCASKIIFVSPALKNRFCNHWFIRTFLSEIEDKMVMMRNGIDDYWIDHVNHEQMGIEHNVLYVGTLIRRKNPILLIQTVLDLVTKYPDLKLNIIGSTGEDEKVVQEYARKYKDIIIYHGQIKNKEELLRNYRSNSIFVLPSVGETFGLVYLEALSQNLPVVYTKGDGIDGLLVQNNGVGITYPTLEIIKEAIINIFENRSYYSNTGFEFDKYRWNVIAEEYSALYNKILKADASA